MIQKHLSLFCCVVTVHPEVNSAKMSSLDHGVGSANHHGKSQWFVKGGVPGGSSGNGFVYGSNIPPGYKAGKRVWLTDQHWHLHHVNHSLHWPPASY